MRIHEILSEAPLVDYKPIGDFEKPGSFSTTKYDPKLATNAINIANAKKFFAGTDYELRLYPVNKPGLRKYSESGAVNPAELIKILPEAESIINDPNGTDTITVFYVSNVGANKVPFTPWIMAHRLGHALRAGGKSHQWKEYESQWNTFLKEIFNNVYGRKISGDAVFSPQLSAPISAICNSIGTMRSARKGAISRPYEFLYEMFAQYINSGEIKFNKLPSQIVYGKKAWGNSGNSLAANNQAALNEFNENIEMYARDLGYYIDNTLGASLNSYYIM